jgi:hypothetical protein
LSKTASRRPPDTGETPIAASPPGSGERPEGRDLVAHMRRWAGLAIVGAVVSLPLSGVGSVWAKPDRPAAAMPVQAATGGGAAADAAKPGGKSAPGTAGPTPGPPKPKNLEPLPPGKYASVLGKKVAGPDGRNLGLIVDIIVDVYGTPHAAVIDFGGFLGVGSRKIAVDWRLLNFAPDRSEDQIWLSLDRSEIQAAPEYRNAASDAMVGPPWAIPPPPATGK